MMYLNRSRKVLLSPVDTAWLRMEVPTNLMMITGIFMFDEVLDFERLEALVEERLLSYDRFRQRVVQSPFRFRPPYWEDDPNFEVSSHLHRIALPAPGNKDALQALVNDMMSTPLDMSRPLWQFHLVENYGSGCALLCRLHHSIGDGIALMKVLLAMTDEEAEPSPPVVAASGSEGRRSAGPLDASFRLASKLYGTGRGVVGQPGQVVGAARFGVESAAALANLLLLSPDPRTRFKGKLGVPKRCAWSDPIDLADVKAVGQVTGGTVNDVLLAAAAGALGRYLRHNGEPVGGLDIRAVVPVNLRPPDEAPSLGNKFGLVFLSLPVGIEDPLDRLFELKRRMDGIKGSQEALVAFGILNAIGIASSEIEELVVDIFEKKATAVMTNVPGPREIRYFAGKPIRGLMFWVPQSGRLGLGLSILSYAGEVLVGIASDAGLTPDPEAVVAAFHDEFDSMMELVRQARQADAEMAATSRA
jgi:diacylglycerol O-acyltransferase